MWNNYGKKWERASLENRMVYKICSHSISKAVEILILKCSLKEATLDLLSETVSEMQVINVIVEYAVIVCIRITDYITNGGKGYRILFSQNSGIANL